MGSRKKKTIENSNRKKFIEKWNSLSVDDKIAFKAQMWEYGMQRYCFRDFFKSHYVMTLTDKKIEYYVWCGYTWMHRLTGYSKLNPFKQ